MTAGHSSPSSRAALASRYAGSADPVPAGAPLNAVIETLIAHRSVRAYVDAPLPTGLLELLIAAGQSTASSSNLQTWSVLEVRDEARRARLAHLAGDQPMLVQCGLLLVFLADLARSANVAAARGIAHEALDFTEMFLTAALDAALAAQSMVVAAESLGLGTVYIGAMRNRPEDVAEVLGLPPRVFAVFGLCIGWPDPARPAEIKPRLAAAAILHRDKYDRDSWAPALEAYDPVMRGFYEREGMPVAGGWSVRSAKRVEGPGALSGRDRLRAALARLGFSMR